MASLIRKVGASENDGLPLYHILVAPLGAKKTFDSREVWHHGVPDDSQAALCRVITRLDSLKLPAAPKGIDQFESLAMREVALAARMDVLAAKRGLVTLDLRESKSVAPKTLRDLGADMRRMVTDFEKLWLARSRPSRLKDNRTFWRKCDAELRKLLRR